MLLFGSADRVAALGGNAAMWEGDYSNISVFPHTMSDQNVAWTNGSNFTAIWDEDGTTWGFSGGDANDVVNMFWGNGTYGVKFGLNMDGGTDAVVDNPDTPDVDETAAAVDGETNFNIGFGTDFGFGDMGFTYDGTDMGFNLRRAQNLWLFENMLVGFNMNGETEEGADDGFMTAGAAFYSNKKVENANGLFGLGFHWSNETEDGALNLNWTFGVESNMTDFATVRVGYNKAYDLMNSVGTPGVVTMGLGFDYGGLGLDMVLSNQNLFTNPVHYVWGRNAEALASGFTISYIW